MFFGLEPIENNAGDSGDYSTHDFIDGDEIIVGGKKKYKVKIGKKSDEFDSEIKWKKKSGYKKRKRKKPGRKL